MNTFIIAEAGINHNGSLELAFKLINAAASAGADAIKFQTYRTKLLANESAGLAAYQIANTDEFDSQVSMLSKFELSNENHIELIEYAPNLHRKKTRRAKKPKNLPKKIKTKKNKNQKK